jgi:hypothetical protein
VVVPVRGAVVVVVPAATLTKNQAWFILIVSVVQAKSLGRCRMNRIRLRKESPSVGF